MKSAWLGSVLLLAVALVSSGDAVAGGASAETIPWTRDYEAAVKEAKQTGRPLLLNFYCGT